MQLTRGFYRAGAIAFGSALICMSVLSTIGRLKPSTGLVENASSPAAGDSPGPAAKSQDRAPAEAIFGGSESWTVRTKDRSARAAVNKAPVAASNTLWNHDGSTVRLEAIGRARRFYFAGLRRGAPAKGGDVVFDGVREGPALSGVAFVYSEKCPATAYQVRGSVSPDETTIKLRGKKPGYDGQCKIAGYADEELEFRLAGKL